MQLVVEEVDEGQHIRQHIQRGNMYGSMYAEGQHIRQHIPYRPRAAYTAAPLSMYE
jgi:hypothetical protein